MKIGPELAAIVGELDFDPEALHAKYIAERDKRCLLYTSDAADE